MSVSNAAATVPLRKYRRLLAITYVLVGACALLGISLASQTSRDSTQSSAETSDTEKEGAAADTPAFVRNDPKDARAIGDIDAPLVLVEWTDMRCPFCAVYTRDTMPQIIQEYVDEGKIRIEINDVAFFGDESIDAAVAARAAGNQGKYFEYLDVLYAAAPESGHPDMPREKLLDFARAAGVKDLARFETDLADPQLRTAVTQSTAQAQQIGVNSVPFFYANGQAIAGAQPIASFREFIDSALAQRESAETK